jgi:hypothetical protein
MIVLEPAHEMIIISLYLQGRVQFPTGGQSPRAERQMQCDFATDSKVWMGEDKRMQNLDALKDTPSSGFLHLLEKINNE